jgi:putative ABC transport system permease protein
LKVQANRRGSAVAPVWPIMDLLWKDIRYALHSLRANPGFALVAILTLALGIGATTAIFSVVNGVLLQPLPLKDPDRLVMVWERAMNNPAPQAQRNVASPGNVFEWMKEIPRTFSSLGASTDWEVSLTGQAEPELVLAGLASGQLFQTLGAKPYLGRYLEPADATGEADGRVVLSYAFWQRKFGGDRRVIGRRVQVDGEAYTIIGIMPREFIVPESRAEMWVPFIIQEGGRGRFLRPIGRLAPGVTIEQAQARMEVVAKRLEIANPERNAQMSVNIVPVHEQVVGSMRRSLLIVFAAVALLLLIGCVNIANLLLSRATARAKEMSIRSALGASRGQLVRQLLTESLILAILAGIVGVVIAGWATMLLVRFTPESAMLPRTAEIVVDGRVLGVTALLTLATGIFFGLAPALEASRTDLSTGLKSGSRGSTHDRRGKMFRNALVVTEVALATVLLIGAGLLIKSFSKLESVSPGVRPERAVTARVVLTDPYMEGEPRRQMMTRMLEKVRTLPGVEHAGAIVSLNMPFTSSLSRDSFQIEGEPVPKEGEEPGTDVRAVAGDYFRAMGMTLIAGRVFDARVIDPNNCEIVVNETLARTHFGSARNALGKRLKFEWYQPLRLNIVGVVNDVRAAGLGEAPATALYFSYAFDPQRQFTIVASATTAPRSLQVPLARALRSLDPLMPVKDVKTLEELISGTIARPRFNATMLSLFAALGLLLASLGIYGVLSYSVSQRTHEMGIRMALGADPRDVLRLVVRDGLKVAVLGVLVGVAVALPATRVLAALLYGVEASDPLVFASVAATLTLVALAASYLPARRATRVQPMVALRPE